MKNQVKPLPGKVFSDEHEARASDYFETFRSQKKKNPELLLKAASEFEKSSNPEGKEIALFLRALYFREKGIREKNNERACKLLLKAHDLFNKDKRAEKEAKNSLLEFHKRKLEIALKKKKNPIDIFMKRATLFKELGKEEAYDIEMSLYCLFDSTNNLDNLPVAIKKLEKGLEHAKRTGKKEIVYKLEGILHKLKSHNSKTIDEAIKELRREIKAIEKTSDKYGMDTALGDLRFLRARKESEPNKRARLLEEAAESYKKAGMEAKAYQLIGYSCQIKANKLTPLDKGHADYYKKAAENYAKAGNTRMQKWLEGHYEVALATKLGVLADNSQEFEKHLIAANHLYRDAGNIGGMQFTAGIGIFLEAIRADYPQSLALFKSAAGCLDSVKEKFLGAIAKSEIARIEASKATDIKERNKLMLEEKNHLERAIIEGEKKKTKSDIAFPVGGITISPEILMKLNKARVEELSGFLEPDREAAKTHYKRAKQEYLSIENTGTYPSIVLSGIGWMSLFLEDAYEAKKYFEKLEKMDADNPHVKLGLDSLDKLLKFKYSAKTEKLIIKQRLSTPLMISLSNDVTLVKKDKPCPSVFFNLCLAIVKRSCNQIERYKSDFFDSSEPALRNEVLRLSNSIAEEGLGSTITAETFTSKGKSDIFAKNSQDESDYFIGEAKIWKSPSGYKKGFKQLVGRYLTDTDRAGLLVNFVKGGDIAEISEKAIQATKEIDKQTKINNLEGNSFMSSHKDYGLIFHYFVDLRQDRTKSEVN